MRQFDLRDGDRSLLANSSRSKVNEDSILAVQVFDQKKFKKKDQGFLGVINIRIGDVIELAPDADGKSSVTTTPVCDDADISLRRDRPDAYQRPEEID